MSHTHCVHDQFRHMHSKYVTYLITKYLNRLHPQVQNLK